MLSGTYRRGGEVQKGNTREERGPKRHERAETEGKEQEGSDTGKLHERKRDERGE
jgi:hypothetical protein